MTYRCAVVFPGQGAYMPGALSQLADGEPLVEETLRLLDQAAARAGRIAPSRLLLDDHALSLSTLVEESPADLHTALYAGEMTLFRLLTERHGVCPDVLLGHSFGELVALTAAGVYDLAEGMALVAARDDAFAACPPVPGGMVALSLCASRAEAFLIALGEWEITVAADNSPRQTVVSGPVEALGRVNRAAARCGIDATMLRVPYAFHNRSLAAVADDFTRRAEALAAARHASELLYSAILGRHIETGEAAHDLVAAHLVRPTHFTDAVRRLHADGVEVFIECGPRSVLSDLIAATVPGVRTIAPLRRRVGARELAESLSGLGAPESAAPPGPAPRDGYGPEDGRTPRRPQVPVPVDAGTPAEEPAEEVPGTGSELPDRDTIVSTLREMYAEALGYPPEVLTGDADLEADLGVDSIKQIELFSQAVARYGRTLPADGARLTSYTTLHKLAELMTSLPADSKHLAEARS